MSDSPEREGPSESPETPEEEGPQEEAPAERPRSLEVVLRKPIEAHGETRTKLVIHRPGPVEYEAMDKGKGDIGKGNYLLAACARIPKSSVMTMDADDWADCMEALAQVDPTSSRGSGESDG